MYNIIYCKDIVPISSSLNQVPDITQKVHSHLPGGTVPLLGPSARIRTRHLMTLTIAAMSLEQWMQLWPFSSYKY